MKTFNSIGRSAFAEWVQNSRKTLLLYLVHSTLKTAHLLLPNVRPPTNVYGFICRKFLDLDIYSCFDLYVNSIAFCSLQGNGELLNFYK